MAKKASPPPPRKALKKGEVPKSADSGPTPSKEAKAWQAKVTRGNKQYAKWAEDYDVKHLEEYYLGRQWKGEAEEAAKRKYVINLIFATVETQLPSLLFSRPKVTVEARPNHEQTSGSDAAGRATLIEQMLQTFIDDRDLHFGFITTLSLREAYPRFGMVEVGYTADYIDNPNADKPILKDDDKTPMTGDDGEPVRQPKRKLQKESLYLKRVPAKDFRCYPGRNILEENDWVGYPEWHYVSDVKANKAYANTATLKATGTIADAKDDTADRDVEHVSREDMVRLWKIWDLRAKKKIVFAEGHDQILMEKAFTFLPLAGLKFYEIGDKYYPLPPIYNWISPQDEINESREMSRVHRRRAVRHYLRDPRFAQVEFEKLETGEDMSCAEVANPAGALVPVESAPLEGATWQQLAATKDDFNLITGVGGEARGVPEADTATQANIINIHASLRESSARQLVANWLGDLVRLMLLTIRESMQLPMMVRTSTDPFAKRPAVQPDPVGNTIAAAGARTLDEWKEIKSEDIADLNVDVKIDVASLSPVAEDAQRQQWNTVLQLLTSPQLGMVLFMPNPDAPSDPSPLLRKTLTLNGIKSDQEIREIWRVGQAVIAQASQSAQVSTAAQADKPRISYAFSDLSDPLAREAFLRAEGLQNTAAAMALQPGGAAPPTDRGGGAPVLPAQPGSASGTPAALPGATT